MRLDRLWLQDFRTYAQLDLELPPGLTCIIGQNGIGKTNLLESIAYAVTLESFRGAESAALVRVAEPPAPRAIVRAQGMGFDRDVLVELEIRPQGRGRVQLNRKRLTRTGDLLERWRVSVFSPDDLSLVKGSPGGRREFMDRAVVMISPAFDGVRKDLARVLKQRNALLRQNSGRLDADATMTLDVFDERLAALGERVGSARLQLLHDVTPYVQEAYATLAGAAKQVELLYDPAWMQEGLHDALTRTRSNDVRRGVSQVGPHRDDLGVVLGGLPARSHASQGEQRSLALALRLGVHLLVADQLGEPPILLLDDVFSELDNSRSNALFAALPPGQALLTSAIDLPEGAEPELTLSATPGTLTPV